MAPGGDARSCSTRSPLSTKRGGAPTVCDAGYRGSAKRMSRLAAAAELHGVAEQTNLCSIATQQLCGVPPSAVVEGRQRDSSDNKVAVALSAGCAAEEDAQIRGELAVPPSSTFCVGAKSPANRAGRHASIESKLYRLLAKLQPIQRQDLFVRAFTERQRLALERWILANRDDRAATSTAVTSSCSRSSGSACRSGRLVGLHKLCRGGKTLYQASMIVGPFRLTTGCSVRREKVYEYLEVLRRIRSCVSGLRTSSPTCVGGGGADTRAHADQSDEAKDEAVAARFRAAVAEEPQRVLGVAGALSLRLHFYATVPASIWVGRPLSTPSFDACTATGLEAGLRAWRRLSRARVTHGGWQGWQTGANRVNRYTIVRLASQGSLAAAWERLRQAYVDVWADAGYCPKRVAQRLQELEIRHMPHRKLQIERWGRLGPSKDKQVRSCKDNARTRRIECKVRSLLQSWTRNERTMN